MYNSTCLPLLTSPETRCIMARKPILSCTESNPRKQWRDEYTSHIPTTFGQRRESDSTTIKSGLSLLEAGSFTQLEENDREGHQQGTEEG